MDKEYYEYLITEKQRRFLSYLLQNHQGGVLPSYSVIMEHFGWRSKNTVSTYYKYLSAVGVVSKENHDGSLVWKLVDVLDWHQAVRDQLNIVIEMGVVA